MYPANFECCRAVTSWDLQFNLSGKWFEELPCPPIFGRWHHVNLEGGLCSWKLDLQEQNARSNHGLDGRTGGSCRPPPPAAPCAPPPASPAHLLRYSHLPLVSSIHIPSGILIPSEHSLESCVELFTIGTIQVFTSETIHYWAAVSYVELQFPCFPPRLFLSLSLCPVQFVFLVQRSWDLILGEPFMNSITVSCDRKWAQNILQTLSHLTLKAILREATNIFQQICSKYNYRPSGLDERIFNSVHQTM